MKGKPGVAETQTFCVSSHKLGPKLGKGGFGDSQEKRNHRMDDLYGSFQFSFPARTSKLYTSQ